MSTIFRFEMRTEQGWRACGHFVDEACGTQDASNYFDARAAAEADLPQLAAVLECDVADLRVVEVSQ
jgi:hypothetical protein